MTNRMLSRIGRAVAAVAVAAALAMGGSSAAFAAESAATDVMTASAAGSAVSASNLVVPTATIDDDGATVEPVSANDMGVPMFRWIGGTQSFHFQVDGNPISAAIRGSERTIFYGLPMMIGNSMWQGSSSLLQGALKFKPMRIVGYEVDQAAAGVGEAIIMSPLISLAFVIIAFGTIFGLKRGERPWRRVWTTGAVAAIFFVMVFGARNSTKSGDEYNPGAGSPGWFLTIITNATSKITSTVATSLDGTSSFDLEGGGGCASYVATIIDTQRYATKNDSISPMASSLWVQTGLKAWSLAQFGDNAYAEKVYCHVLDWAYPNYAANILDTQGEYPPAVTNSAALSPDSDAKRDASAIAWAVCTYNKGSGSWSTAPNFFMNVGDTKKWGPGDNRGTSDPRGERSEYEGENGFCNNWWNQPSQDWDSDRFQVGPNEHDVVKFMGGETGTAPKKAVYEFLTYWHGADNSGIGVTMSYSLSSLIISAVFLIVSGAVFFVNIAIVAALLSIFIVLLVVLFTKNDLESRLAGFVKNLLGLVVFSSIAALLIALIAKITEVLGQVGGSIFAQAPIANMIWTGLSPLFALIMLHFVFTKLLRVPSPFKLSSALAWGAAAGAAGGAVGAGAANALGRADRKIEDTVKSAPGALARKGKNLIAGGKGKGSERDGAAQATDRKVDRGKLDDKTKDEAGDAPTTARGRREELKEARKEAKEARKLEAEGNKNDKYLSFADSLMGGKGTLEAETGWRGVTNRVSKKLGMGAVLSEKDYSDTRSLSERLREGGDTRTAAVLDRWKEQRQESRAAFAEKWRENPKAAVGQVVRKTGKYAAVGLATVATGGAAGVAYGAYRAAKASINTQRDLGYLGGNKRSDGSAVAVLRERRASEAKALAERQKAEETAQQAQQRVAQQRVAPPPGTRRQRQQTPPAAQPQPQPQGQGLTRPVPQPNLDGGRRKPPPSPGQSVGGDGGKRPKTPPPSSGGTSSGNKF